MEVLRVRAKMNENWILDTTVFEVLKSYLVSTPHHLLLFASHLPRVICPVAGTHYRKLDVF